MSNETMATHLMWANVCIERIDRALRQHKRLQKAFRKQEAETERLIQADGQLPRPMPKSWTDLEARFQDHLYYFILTARQAAKAAWVLEQRGEQMPHVRQFEQVLAWRNFLEHWDDEARGKKSKAGQEWLEVSGEEEPGLSLGSEGNRLTLISGVKVRRLVKDLKRARKAAGEVSEREWLRCYITAEEAAGVLGLSADEFDALEPKPLHMDFGFGDGVRYWREWVEARRDGRLIPPGWEDYVTWDNYSDDLDD
ncbi:hypothetical protein [Nocardioides sp. MH1]|uniref:hypothetical protein n=1 Tax=Nocardioides sp. MH1 TaxID=3242490 RepID=UPI0035229F43